MSWPPLLASANRSNPTDQHNSPRLSYILLSTPAQPANGIGHSKQVQFPANAGEGLKKELANPAGSETIVTQVSKVVIASPSTTRTALKNSFGAFKTCFLLSPTCT